MFLALLMLAGCSRTPTLSSVAPTELSPGEDVQIFGESFGPDMLVYLTLDGKDAVVLGGVDVQGDGLVIGTVPERLAPGVYDVLVDRKGRRASLDDALHVVPPVDEVACSDAYTANTELSLVRQEVVVDRFYRDGDRQTVRMPLEKVERVEYELLRDGDGRCSVIYLRTADGRRVVFDDDREVDLRERAVKIAQDMGRPLEIGRTADAAAMTD